MAANTAPIFSRQGEVEGSAILTLAANDYNGQGVNNVMLFEGDDANGNFIQRLRLKALGTNVASVLRIFFNTGDNPRATGLAAVSGTPTGTPSASGGTLASGTYFAKVYAVDQWGGITAASTETASVSVTGPTGSIAWAWTAVTGAVSYIVTVGNATGNQFTKFTSTTNSLTQTAPGVPFFEQDLASNNYLFGEISLPATTAIATAGTIEIDYPMNVALRPGMNIICGLGTAVAAGWQVIVIGGTY